VGDPVSHCSVGSSTFSWSIARAGCTATTPKREAAAAETKAVRDISAFNAVVVHPDLEADGANAEQHATRVDRRAMIFMVYGGLELPTRTRERE
jgi:hypothetical protein